MGYPRQLRSRQLVKARRTSGDITLNSTSWANVDTGLDMTLDECQVGDEIVYGLSAAYDNQTVEVYIDVVTVVSGSPVNSFAVQGAVEASPGYEGIQGFWIGNQSEQRSKGGQSMPYTLVAGDLVGEAVTFRLRYATSPATNRTLRASTLQPLDVWVMNLGPAS